MKGCGLFVGTGYAWEEQYFQGQQSPDIKASKTLNKKM
jgi:hypothetical protein